MAKRQKASTLIFLFCSLLGTPRNWFHFKGRTRVKCKIYTVVSTKREFWCTARAQQNSFSTVGLGIKDSAEV